MKQTVVHLLTVLIVALIILLPSIVMNSPIEGTTNGKMFFFLFLILIGTFFLCFKIIISPTINIHFSNIDFILFIWISYILFNAEFHHVPISGRLLELYGLIALYIILRQFEPSRFRILLGAMIIGATIQAIYGNLQLWGYCPSYHALFSMTGSFFNPGPFAGYLSCVFPVALGFYLFKPIKSVTVMSIIGFSLIVILMVLVASRSLAAWLALSTSSIILLSVRYHLFQWLKRGLVVKHKIVLLWLVCITIGIGGILGIFQMKTGSSNGRLLIWKITSGMIAEHPVTGVGIDRFKAYYMDKQGAYFKEKPDSPEVMLAGDTNYCFNELLQHTVENGIIGLILMLTTGICVFCTQSSSFYELSWIAKAGVMGIIVFAMFSYPAHVLPIKINLVCYLAFISTLSKQKTDRVPIKKYVFVKYSTILFLSGSLIIGFSYLSTYYKAYKNWNRAYLLYKIKNYTGSLEIYESVWTPLKYNGNYLTHYGKALNIAGKQEQSIVILQQAVKYYPNTVAYTTLGDNYKVLEKFAEAEQFYLKASYMNPSRFYPKYLLAKLYDETGQTEKAIMIAQELLNKTVKIESTAIDEIKDEMRNILQKKNKIHRL